MFKRLYYIILQRLYVLKNSRKPCQGKVYMFHNVSDNHDTYSITKEHFEEFINYLMKNRRIVDAKTLISENDPDNVVITFDDVYESVYHNAYPLLKEYGIPFYLFVCNEFLNKDGYIKSEMISEMLNDSKAILGSHNLKHELSRFVDNQAVKENLKRSKEELEKEFGGEVNEFAFPFGSIYACSNENVAAASGLFRNVFMTYAIPYNGEYGRIIPRININDETYGKEMP